MILNNILSLIKSYNTNFQLQKVDTRYSEYQAIILSSVMVNEKIRNIEHKNKVYISLKSQNKESIKKVNLNIMFDKIVQQDRNLINKAIEQYDTLEQNYEIITKNKIKGVVAVLEYDYV